MGGMHPFIISSDGERGLGRSKETMCLRDRIELYNWTLNEGYIQCDLSEQHPVNNIKTTYDYIFTKRRSNG